MLLSGLQALTITDPSLKPLEQFQDQMIRRTVSQRKRSSVVPLELILQIHPLKCEYHMSVLSLLFNIWCTGGNCYERTLGDVEVTTISKMNPAFYLKSEK